MKQQRKVHRVFINSIFNTDIFTCSHELSHRIKNVLRIKENDELIIFNNKKQQYLCSVNYENKNIILILKNKIPLQIPCKKKYISCSFYRKYESYGFNNPKIC
jgi:16S rRNA U1498 N3-methylase RsmE